MKHKQLSRVDTHIALTNAQTNIDRVKQRRVEVDQSKIRLYAQIEKEEIRVSNQILNGEKPDDLTPTRNKITEIESELRILDITAERANKKAATALGIAREDVFRSLKTEYKNSVAELDEALEVAAEKSKRVKEIYIHAQEQLGNNIFEDLSWREFADTNSDGECRLIYWRKLCKQSLSKKQKPKSNLKTLRFTKGCNPGFIFGPTFPQSTYSRGEIAGFTKEQFTRIIGAGYAEAI